MISPRLFALFVHGALLLPIAAAASSATAPALPVAPFPLSAVRLLDSPFKQAMDRNGAYLLSLEPDRFLHNTRKYAGLEPKGPLYGGWEARGIAGHSLGHYLTALALHYAATGDARFRERIDYTVTEMAECQRLYGDGYIGALPPKELETMRAFKAGTVEPAGAFNFKGGAWVPWYTQHKVLAGLKDAWVLGGSEQAREVTLKLADWVDTITAHLTPGQQQAMLQVEFGGMNEVLVELHALTGNPRYLDASRRFYHEKVLDPLAAGRDELTGIHANTQIPKIVGEARRYEVTGDANGRKISEFFWDRVVRHRSWALGGNSDHEHFFPIGQAAGHLGPQAAESCNTYNMLRLTGHLFTWEPKAEYADYYERALYNHILASQDPRHGMFAYFISHRPGHFKTYSTPDNSFWCCVGSGMENHTKYGEAIYFHGADELYVNLFLPSVLTWRERGVVLEQRTEYPRGNVTELTFQSAPAEPLTLHVRCPAWATGPLVFDLNGRRGDVVSQKNGYATLRRSWKKGDRLRITIPMGLRTERLEGRADKLAFFYGPLLLAGDLGAAPESKTFPLAGDHLVNANAPTVPVPVLVVPEGQSVESTLRPVAGEPLAFRTEGVGQPADATLRPFLDLPYHHYTLYWDVLTPGAWQERKSAIEAEAELRRLEQARIVDEFNPGEQQSEIEHKVTSERSITGSNRDRKWRDAREGGWFALELKVARDLPQLLRCTYWGDDAGARTFDILVDGERIATQRLNRDRPGRFFDVEYAIPPALLAGKDTVTVRFQAHPGNMAGGLYRCAVMKAE